MRLRREAVEQVDKSAVVHRQETGAGDPATMVPEITACRQRLQAPAYSAQNYRRFQGRRVEGAAEKRRPSIGAVNRRRPGEQGRSSKAAYQPVDKPVVRQKAGEGRGGSRRLPRRLAYL